MKGLGRLGGVLLILTSIFYVLTFIFSGAIYGVFGLIATVLMGPTILVLYSRYRGNEGGIAHRIGLIALIVGSLCISLLYIAAFLGSVIEGSGKLDQTVVAGLEVLLTSLSGLGIMFGNTIFIGTFIYALISVRDSKDPKWLGWIGMVGSVVTLPWFLFTMMPPILQIIPAFGFAVVLIWLTIIGAKEIAVG